MTSEHFASASSANPPTADKQVPEAQASLLAILPTGLLARILLITGLLEGIVKGQK
jgi:hypothetical protein